MKKGFIITVGVLIVLLALSGSVFFFGFPKFSNESATNASQNPAPELKSFRGVLADILKDAEKEASEIKDEIAEAIPNRFSGDDKTAAPKSDVFTFAILGDTQYFKAGNSRGNFQKAMAQIAKLNPNMIFSVGDLVGSCDGDSKCSKEYTDWKNIVGGFIGKTYATQGNHDRTGDDKTDKVWRDSFNFPTNGPSGFREQVYSFDFENSHFVVLDSDKPKEHLVNGEQRAWLEKDLAANRKEKNFVFYHEPAHPVSSKTQESLDVEPSERNALWEILNRHNVTAVFNGHEHIVSRRKINQTYQFVFATTDPFNHDLPAAGIAEYAHQEQGCYGVVKVVGKEITGKTHTSER